MLRWNGGTKLLISNPYQGLGYLDLVLHFIISSLCYCDVAIQLDLDDNEDN